MPYFKIKGGETLKGSIAATSGKNSPIALLCASLLIRGKSVFHDMTPVEEVHRMIEILTSIGAKVTWKDKETVEVDATGQLHLDRIDKKACSITRVSLLLFGALAAREDRFKVYKSGGCKLGKRTIRPHTLALEKLGIHVDSRSLYYDVMVRDLKGAHVVMYESGDTATENVIMAAVLAPGKTTIKFASANYMVQDVCYFLQEAGANIEGIGTTTLTITGVKSLKPVKNGYHPIPDPVDAFAWIALAATTKSNITITNCPLDFLELELEKLHVMGQRYEIGKERKSTNGHFRVADIMIIPSILTALPDKLDCRPFPGLNIDALPLFVPILTQAKGQTLVHDWVYENRALYYLELQKFGAKVLLMDPHRVLVDGITPLQANEAMCPPALRPAMAVLIAMIAAKGTSVLRNIYVLERGYSNLVERLKKIGVNIERVE